MKTNDVPLLLVNSVEGNSCVFNAYLRNPHQGDLKFINAGPGYVVDYHLTIAGGYANFGNVLNHHEKNVWAI